MNVVAAGSREIGRMCVEGFTAGGHIGVTYRETGGVVAGLRVLEAEPTFVRDELANSADVPSCPILEPSRDRAAESSVAFDETRIRNVALELVTQGLSSDSIQTRHDVTVRMKLSGRPGNFDSLSVPASPKSSKIQHQVVAVDGGNPFVA